MALSNKVKELLNKFADTQIALNIPGLPADQSKIQLGDLLDEAHGAIRSASVVYDVARDGGTDGESYVIKGHNIPSGAIITRAWIAENVALVGVGASLDVKAGSVSLSGGAQLIAAFAGINEAKADFAAVIPAVAGGSSVSIDVSGADVTAGQLLITFEYIYPVN